MERLLAREESNQPWSLRYDRDLLEVLSDLSGDMLDRMQSQESDLADLETATSSTSARLGNAAASFGGLCHSQFIEQEVAPFSATEERRPLSSHVTLTPENFREVVHPKYRQALQLATAAFSEAKPSDGKPLALPLIFGSPEYLQDARFGIGSSSTSQERPQIPVEGPLPEEGVGLVEGEIPIPDVAVEDSDVSEELPDFRSMLEAALRGDLDGGLELAAIPSDQESNPDRGPQTPEHCHSWATPAAADVLRQGSGGGQETGKALSQEADLGGGVEPREVEGLTYDSNSEEYRSPREGSLNLQELLQGHGDLFSEEDLRS